jgi:hypothetical protein
MRAVLTETSFYSDTQNFPLCLSSVTHTHGYRWYEYEHRYKHHSYKIVDHVHLEMCSVIQFLADEGDKPNTYCRIEAG